MNPFSTVTLALSLSLVTASCSKESKKAPETPSHLLPASGTEPDPSAAPPGMTPMEQAGEDLPPSAQGATGPGAHEHEAESPGYAPIPTAGGSGGFGGGGGLGGKGGTGAH